MCLKLEVEEETEGGGRERGLKPAQGYRIRAAAGGATWGISMRKMRSHFTFLATLTLNVAEYRQIEPSDGK